MKLEVLDFGRMVFAWPGPLEGTIAACTTLTNSPTGLMRYAHTTPPNGGDILTLVSFCSALHQSRVLAVVAALRDAGVTFEQEAAVPEDPVFLRMLLATDRPEPQDVASALRSHPSGWKLVLADLARLARCDITARDGRLHIERRTP